MPIDQQGGGANATIGTFNDSGQSYNITGNVIITYDSSRKRKKRNTTKAKSPQDRNYLPTLVESDGDSPDSSQSPQRCGEVAPLPNPRHDIKGDTTHLTQAGSRNTTEVTEQGAQLLQQPAVQLKQDTVGQSCNLTNDMSTSGLAQIAQKLPQRCDTVAPSPNQDQETKAVQSSHPSDKPPTCGSVEHMYKIPEQRCDTAVQSATEDREANSAPIPPYTDTDQSAGRGTRLSRPTGPISTPGSVDNTLQRHYGKPGTGDDHTTGSAVHKAQTSQQHHEVAGRLPCSSFSVENNSSTYPLDYNAVVALQNPARDSKARDTPPPNRNIDPSSDNDAVLASLEIVPISKELSMIVNGAKASLDLITPWCEAKTDHPIVVRVVMLVRSYGQKYCEAINTSIETAQDCHILSHDAVGLCELLLNEHTSEASLREYISDMKDEARACYERTEAVCDALREVYRLVLELSKTVPDEIVKHASTKSIAQRVVIFLSWNGRRRSMDPEDVMKELNLVATDLARLSESVKVFAAWWQMMVTKLGSLETSINKLKLHVPNKARIRRLKTDWQDVEQKYEEYRNDIKKLVHSYPRNLLLEGGAEFMQISSDLSAIVKSAEVNLESMTLWCKAKTDHAVVGNATVIIQKLGRSYCNAINLSIKTALDCHSLSHDIVDLCDHLLDITATERSLTAYFAEMKEGTPTCHQRTEAVQNAFLKTSDSISESSRIVPEEVMKQSQSLFAYFHWGGKPTTREVMKGLHLERPDLESLSDSTAAFAQWWGSIGTKLPALEASIAKLKPQVRQNEVVVRILRKDWEKIKRECEDYHKAIAELVPRFRALLLDGKT